MTVSRVARRCGVTSSLLFRWRRQLCRPAVTAAPLFAPVEVAERTAELPAMVEAASGLIEIELAGRWKVLKLGGVASFRLGNRTAAIDLFRLALQEAPEDAQMLTNLTHSLLEQEDWWAGVIPLDRLGLWLARRHTSSRLLNKSVATPAIA
jgi:hypothetical protein